MDKSRVEASNPLATVEEIQKRLVRPLSLHSQSSTSICTSRDDLTSRDSLEFNVNSTDIRRKRGVTNKRLEDYLDPVLLSAICGKIGGKRKIGGEIKLKEFDQFEWPIDESKVFVEGSRTEKRVKWRSNEAVDLNKDLDLIRDGDEDEHENEDEVSCTPFRRFEITALKRFKG